MPRPGSALVPIAITRLGLGIWMVARPGDLSRLLRPQGASERSGSWLGRMLGAREVALAVGTLIAVGQAEDTPGVHRSWAVAAIIADAGDVAALSVAARIGEVRPVLAALGAGSALVSVGLAAGSLRRT